MNTKDDFRLDGKVALITGGARGIGLECVKAFAAAGCKVMITDILVDRGKASAAELTKSGGDVKFFRHDVTIEDEWQDAISETINNYGGFDILVNNAGVESIGEIVDTAYPDFKRIMTVNVDGVWLGCKHAVAAMRPSGVAGKGGSIVNLSSIAGKRGVSLLSAYGTSKGAVHTLTKDVAIECAQLRYGIRCNSVHPGVVQTEMADDFFEQHKVVLGVETIEDVKAIFNAAHPLGMGTPRDVANSVVFLASDASSWITGVGLSVDGGWAAR